MPSTDAEDPSTYFRGEFPEHETDDNLGMRFVEAEGGNPFAHKREKLAVAVSELPMRSSTTTPRARGKAAAGAVPISTDAAPFEEHAHLQVKQEQDAKEWKAYIHSHPGSPTAGAR